MATKFSWNWPSDVSWTMYLLRNTDGEVWYPAGQVMETYGTSGRDANDYDTQLVGYSGSLWIGTIDPNLPEGTYFLQLFETAGATPVDGDVVDAQGVYDLRWSGSSIISLPGLIVGGDYLVTLTIRTSDSVNLPGAQVWLSADNDRGNPVQATRITNDGGVVTFYLDYLTYYIHCKLAGYTFISASFTAASGSVTFTKDIAAAITSGVDSEYTESYITRALEVCRKFIDAPAENRKYSDNYLLDRMEAAYQLILGEKQRNVQRPIVSTYNITLADSQLTYAMPTTLGPVVSVYHAGESGIKLFYYSYSPFNYGGQGVWVEGNNLRIQTNIIALGSVITIEALANGVARLHRSTCAINSDGDEATFVATPNKGTLDTAVNAYIGSVFRVLQVTGTSPTGNLIQERIITAYNAVTRVATLNCPLDPVPVIGAGGKIYYEIAPQIQIGLDTLPALYAAWEINNTEGKNKQAKGCKDTYNNFMRHLRLESFYSRIDSAGLVDADTEQNASYARSFSGGY